MNAHHHKLKRIYKNNDHDRAQLALAVREIEEQELEVYPVHIRRVGSESRGTDCRDSIELLTEVDLFFQDFPKKSLEVIPFAEKHGHKKEHHRK